MILPDLSPMIQKNLSKMGTPGCVLLTQPPHVALNQLNFCFPSIQGRMRNPSKLWMFWSLVQILGNDSSNFEWIDQLISFFFHHQIKKKHFWEDKFPPQILDVLNPKSKMGGGNPQRNSTLPKTNSSQTQKWWQRETIFLSFWGWWLFSPQYVSYREATANPRNSTYIYISTQHTLPRVTSGDTPVFGS